MKRILKPIATALCLLPLAAAAQFTVSVYNLSDVLAAEPIDKLLFTVQYRASFVVDTLQPDERQEEAMMLKVGSTLSAYYSYSRFHTDSLIEADKAAGAPEEVVREHLKQGGGPINYQIFKNYPQGRTTTLEPIAASRFRSDEATARPVWQLLPDTATILSYSCRKAVCRFRGREWEAWYTPEIPRSEGPWKLQGLPGLILKACDSRRHFAFLATGIEQSRRDEAIVFAGSGYEPISPKALQKVHRRFAADPVGYLAETAPHVQLTVTGDDGQPYRPKDMPYNPIELD